MTAPAPDGIYTGDAATVLATWPADCARSLITSFGYWGLRAYGDHPLELGIEDLHRYLERVVETMAAARRVLTDDALAWVNIGDTYAGSGGAGGDYGTRDGSRARRVHEGRRHYRQGKPTTYGPGGDLVTIPGGQLCDVPGRLARALMDDGWRVRSRITWAKTHYTGTEAVRPENLTHANRPGVSSETILLLAPGRARAERWFPDRLFERGDVWRFPPRTGKWSGPAPFPDQLPLRCILPSTEPGDLVIDPAVGTGTTVRVARYLGRRGAGIDLYADAPAPADTEGTP